MSGRGVRAARPAPRLREQAYESFTHHLLARDIRPGQFISQRELVELTGHTLGAIRELIPRLEADGLIKTVPQRGMQIAHLDVDLIRNAFQFRLFLEREAMLLFAASPPEGEIERLRAAHEAIVEAAEAGIDEALIARAQKVDWDLHDTIIDSLGNAIISDAYRVNSIKIRLIRHEQTRLLPDLLRSVMREHLKIIEALERGDPQEAADALASHITDARNRALGIAFA